MARGPWRAALGAALLFLACGCEPEPTVPTPPVPVVAPETPPEPVPAVEDAAPTPPPAPSPPLPASRRATLGPYVAEVGRHCDGLPFLPLETLPGRCVGLVVHSEMPTISGTPGRFRPRSLVQDPVRDEVFWVVDAGARRPRAGRVWRLERDDDEWRAASVLRRLDRPHGSRVGPDGHVYVGEVQRIVRFDPAAQDPASTVDVVVDDLPVELRGRDRLRYHPLTSFVFTPGWDIVVNMGSGTDRCLESVDQPRCQDEAEHLAGLWRYAYLGEGRWSAEPTHLVQGLRNSVALVAHSSGTVLQAENGVDFSEDDRPHEELNVIVEGKHYGWPYCYDRDRRDPRWTHASFDCDPAANPGYAPPRLLLAPHGAPLGMAYYGGSRMPELTGQLLIGYHGYRAPGHRLVALVVDARGVPAADATPRDVIAGWEPSDRTPRGAPVDFTVARDGSVWLVEDKNGTVLRLAVDAWPGSRAGASQATNIEDANTAPLPAADDAFIALHRAVLAPRCGECHAFLSGRATAALRALATEGWLRAESGVAPMAEHTRPGAVRPMPPDQPLSPEQAAQLEAWLRAQGL